MGKRLDPNKTNPATLWTDAKHMRIGAEVLIIAIDDALARSDTTRFEQLIHPTLLLVGSSMEAGFKSYLNQQGLSLDRLRDDFGHDLHKLQKEVLKHADAALADIVKEATPGIRLLNEPCVNKRFSYREIGSAMYPSPALVSEWIKVYLAKIKPLVLREKKA